MGQRRPEADIIELKLPNRAEYLGIARLTVSGVAHRMGFSYDEIEDIKLAVGEACANAMEHAYAEEGKEGELFIVCRVHPDRLVIDVEDHGTGFTVEPVSQQVPYHEGMDIDELEEGGLGLYLIHALMDEVVIRTDVGVSVSMTKYRRRDGVEGVDRTVSEGQV